MIDTRDARVAQAMRDRIDRLGPMPHFTVPVVFIMEDGHEWIVEPETLRRLISVAIYDAMQNLKELE